MNRALSVVLVAAAIMTFGVRESAAQWTPTGGPDAAWVSSFAVLGDKIFAGTGAGVFVLAAGDTAWRPVNEGLKCPQVHGLATVGSSLFAATDWLNMAPWLVETMKGNIGGVFRSDDQGLTWVRANAGLPAHTDIRSFAVIGKVLYLGSDAFVDDEAEIEADGGIFATVDGGQSWTDTGSMNSPFLASVGTSLFGQTLLDGFVRSKDGGKTWRAAGKGLPGAAVLCLAASGKSLLVGTSQGLFVSTDDAASWTSAGSGLPPASPIRSLATEGTRVFAATANAVFLSDNGGRSWVEAGTGLPGDVVIWALAATQTDVFAGTEGKGVWRLPLREAAGTKR